MDGGAGTGKKQSLFLANNVGNHFQSLLPVQEDFKFHIVRSSSDSLETVTAVVELNNDISDHDLSILDMSELVADESSVGGSPIICSIAPVCDISDHEKSAVEVTTDVQESITVTLEVTPYVTETKVDDPSLVNTLTAVARVGTEVTHVAKVSHVDDQSTQSLQSPWVEWS